MARLHANNYITSLVGNISNSATSIVVASAAGFPAVGGSDVAYVTLQNLTAVEIVKVTAISGTTLTVVRAQESTVAQTFPNGSTVSIRPTAGSFDFKVDGIGSSTDNAIVRWDGTNGRGLQNSGVFIDDSNNITGGTWTANKISEAYGGTNQSSYTLGDILYSSASNTLSKLAGNITSSKKYLSQTGTGSVSAPPSWSVIDGGDITGYALTKVDDTNVTLTLGGTPATALLKAASLTVGWAGLLSVARGGTNVSSVTTSPTATSFAGWDANSNLSANSFLEGYATTATAAGTTTLTVASAEQQFFTGSTTQTVILPVTSTLVLGQKYRIVNNSTGSVTVQSSGSNTISTLVAGTTGIFTCILTSGTTAASWSAAVSYSSNGNVIGPTSSTDRAFVLWNGTSGTSVQNSPANCTLSSTGLAAFASYLTIETAGIKLWSGKTTPVTTSTGCGGLVFNVGVSTGTQNTAFGYSTLRSITSGSRNTACGQLALDAQATNSDSTGIGDSALKVATADSNTAVGSSSLLSVSTGGNNTAFGMQSGTNNASGSASLTTGTDNTLIGYRAGVDTNSTIGTIAIGSNAVATKSTGSTSGTNGPGIAIGSASMPVGFRGDGTIFPGNLWRIKVNGTQYMIPLAADGSTALPIANGGTNVTSVTTAPTASSFAGWDANSNLSANNFLVGRTSTATAAGTTTLTVSSAQRQTFTGSTTQTCVMPAVSTLAIGTMFIITNLSSGVVTVQSSGTNTIQAMAANTTLHLISNATSGTGASVWDVGTYTSAASDITGSGSLVRATSPTFVTPALGIPASGDLSNCTNLKNLGSGKTAFRAYRNTNQSITQSVATKIAYANTTFDNGSMFDTVTNNRYQPTVAGTYFVVAQVTYDNVFTAGTFAGAWIYKNGSAISESFGYSDLANHYVSITVFTAVSMNGSTDYLEVFTEQFEASTARNLLGGSLYNYFSGYLIEAT